MMDGLNLLLHRQPPFCFFGFNSNLRSSILSNLDEHFCGGNARDNKSTSYSPEKRSNGQRLTDVSATKKPRRFGQGFLETYVGTYVSRIMRTERAILNFSCCALSIRSHQIQVTSSAKSPVQELPQPQMQHCRQRRRFANPGFLAI